MKYEEEVWKDVKKAALKIAALKWGSIYKA